MPRKIERPNGRITLRTSVERHAELVRISEFYGVDVTAILNMMIRERLPHYRRKVKQLQLQQEPGKPFPVQ